MIVVCSIAKAADVVVDVGHTRLNPGSVSVGGEPEFLFNKRLAETVGHAARALGLATRLINVLGDIRSLTASTDATDGAGLFVSIHHDSVQPQFLPVTDNRFSGFSLWVSRKNPDYAGSVRCATAMANHMMAAGYHPSHYHAEKIPGESRQAIDWDRGIFINDDLVVLKTARSPAVLIEAGVIVHPREERDLKDQARVSQQAFAIASGIKQCVVRVGR